MPPPGIIAKPIVTANRSARRHAPPQSARNPCPPNTSVNPIQADAPMIAVTPPVGIYKDTTANQAANGCVVVIHPLMAIEPDTVRSANGTITSGASRNNIPMTESVVCPGNGVNHNASQPTNPIHVLHPNLFISHLPKRLR
jgi:hypothetical protein